MAGLGAPELLIILVLVLLVFGGTKLPQMARSLGSAKKEFELGRAESEGRATAATSTSSPSHPARGDDAA